MLVLLPSIQDHQNYAQLHAGLPIRNIPYYDIMRTTNAGTTIAAPYPAIRIR